MIRKTNQQHYCWATFGLTPATHSVCPHSSVVMIGTFALFCKDSVIISWCAVHTIWGLEGFWEHKFLLNVMGDKIWWVGGTLLNTELFLPSMFGRRKAWPQRWGIAPQNIYINSDICSQSQKDLLSEWCAAISNHSLGIVRPSIWYGLKSLTWLKLKFLHSKIW